MICKRGADQAYVQMIYTCLHLSKHFFSCREQLKYFLSEFKVKTIV